MEIKVGDYFKDLGCLDVVKVVKITESKISYVLVEDPEQYWDEEIVSTIIAKSKETFMKEYNKKLNGRGSKLWEVLNGR